MATLSVKKEEIVHFIGQLDKKTKAEIFELLKPQILPTRWQSLFKRIDKRLKDNPISEDILNQEVECARNEMSTHRR